MVINSKYEELNIIANELALLEKYTPAAYRLLFAPRIANFFQKNHESLSKIRNCLKELQDSHIEKDEKGNYKQEIGEDKSPVWCYKSAQSKKDFEDGIDALMKSAVRIVL